MINSKHMSMFRPYSYGIVAENKPLDTNLVKVIPVEITPFIDGSVDTDITEIESKALDSEDREYTIKIQKSKAIKCRWLKWGGQRTTAPDVRRNMRVMIYRFADSDIFYWTSLGLDDHLFRLETVTWLFSDDPDGLSDDDRSLENSHSLTVSTHDRHITLQTVDTNNEAFTYTVKLDLAESIFTLTDNADNYFYLDSKNTNIRMHNTEGTWAELNKKNINLYAPDSFSLEAEENVRIQCKNYYLTVGESYSEEIGENHTSNIGGDSVQSVGGNKSEDVSGNYQITTAGYTCDTPTATFTGQVSVGGLSIAPGSAGGGGGAEIAGNITVDGTSTFNAPLTAMKVTSTQPIDAPNV